MPVRLAEAASNAYQYPLLIRHLLHTPLATAPTQQIVYRDRVRYDYTEFHRRIGRLAQALSRLGVESGMTVAVMDWDSHRYLECFFAIPMMGAVLQTVNVRLPATQLAYTLNHANAEVLLVNQEFLPLLDAIRTDLPALRHVILIADGHTVTNAPAGVAAEYEDALAAESGDFPFADFDENAIATTFYTTGTTGHPKGVCFSHRQLVLHTLALMGACGSPAYGQSFRHGDVYMPLTPMFHVHAWGNPFVATLLGVKQVYPGHYVPADILELRAREGVTYSHCVPTILQMLLQAADAGSHNLRGWKICVGGSALPVGLAHDALARGIDIYAGYGMSETGPVLAISRLQSATSLPPTNEEITVRCRTGLPMPLVDIRLIDLDGHVVSGPGRTGEITVRAPWLTPCYTGNRGASESLWDGSYLHTQDVARIDGQGYLQITDRLKDVIKTGGEWVSSLDLEAVISRNPDVLEVAVIGIADPKWGERPCALVVPRPGADPAPTAESIRTWVSKAIAAGELPRYALPDRVSIVASLPRTSVGKINKRALREEFR
jgi:fatty-acyl-CoA synthase